MKGLVLAHWPKMLHNDTSCICIQLRVCVCCDLKCVSVCVSINCMKHQSSIKQKEEQLTA